MVENDGMERFYTYIDRLASALEKKDGIIYLEGINEALNYLLDDKTNHVLGSALSALFHTEKGHVVGRDFSKSDIRKAIQMALLKGLKRARITNAQITPDSIGMFIAYLLDKLYPGEKPTTMFDPLIGTANLATTIIIQSGRPIKVHGVDDDEMMLRLARNMCDALDMPHRLTFQDTLSYDSEPVDAIVTDFPPHKTSDATYFPYGVILHHVRALTAGGFFIALVENDFFDRNGIDAFKARLHEHARLYGLVKLDEGMFTTHAKSILIIRKHTKEQDDKEAFLLVDLPPFSDVAAFRDALDKMNLWFSKRKVDVQ